MARNDYNECMIPYISKGGETGAQHRMDFCIGAKICSGRAANEDDARKICLLDPKVVNPGHDIDPGAISKCLLPKIAAGVSLQELQIAVSECLEDHPGKPLESLIANG